MSCEEFRLKSSFVKSLWVTWDLSLGRASWHGWILTGKVYVRYFRIWPEDVGKKVCLRNTDMFLFADV